MKVQFICQSKVKPIEFLNTSNSNTTIKPILLVNQHYINEGKSLISSKNDNFEKMKILLHKDEDFNKEKHKDFEVIELNKEKKTYVKAFLYWIKEEAKNNHYEGGYVTIFHSEYMNVLLNELTNFENYDENFLYEFEDNSISQITISKNKETKIDFLNLYKENFQDEEIDISYN